MQFGNSSFIAILILSNFIIFFFDFLNYSDKPLNVVSPIIFLAPLRLAPLDMPLYQNMPLILFYIKLNYEGIYCYYYYYFQIK